MIVLLRKLITRVDFVELGIVPPHGHAETHGLSKTSFFELVGHRWQLCQVSYTFWPGYARCANDAVWLSLRTDFFLLFHSTLPGWTADVSLH